MVHFTNKDTMVRKHCSLLMIWLLPTTDELNDYITSTLLLLLLVFQVFQKLFTNILLSFIAYYEIVPHTHFFLILVNILFHFFLLVLLLLLL